MCSNYRPATARHLEQLGADAEQLKLAAGDTYPGGQAPVILPAEGISRQCALGTFGLLPVWAKDRSFAKRTYNARAETVAEKPSFRHAWGHRQLCIVPAAAFYEPCYETGKAVWWRIERAGGGPMAIAGMWETKRWPDGGPDLSFTMLTVNADDHPLMRRFHKPKDEKRTVVVLDEANIDRWLLASSPEQMRQLLANSQQVELLATEGRLGTN